MRRLEEEGEDNRVTYTQDKPSLDPMSVSLSDIRIPRGRLLMVENGVEIEILKREMPEGESQP